VVVLANLKEEVKKTKECTLISFFSREVGIRISFSKKEDGVKNINKVHF